jgi:uncharacterized protein (DUF1697 family)
MPRYVVFLRGITPMNAKMSELKDCFEIAGFTNVRTVLGSGNVVVDSTARSDAAVERLAQKAMERTLGRVFLPIVRSTKHLQRLLDDNPFAKHRLPAGAKFVVTFLPSGARPAATLPPPRDGVSMFHRNGGEIFTAYVPNEKGPVFMREIERAFGKDVTTRTWDTVRKCANA